MNEHKANGPEPNNAANDPPVTPKKQKIDPLEIRAKALEYDGLVARCPIQYGGDFTLLTPSTSSSSRRGHLERWCSDVVEVKLRGGCSLGRRDRASDATSQLVDLLQRNAERCWALGYNRCLRYRMWFAILLW